jgi:hypothetical protein
MLGLLLHRNMSTGRGVDIVVVRVEMGLGFSLVWGLGME